MVEVNRRMELLYDPGQMTFRSFIHTSSDQQLYDLGNAINAFQDTPVAEINLVQTFELAD